MSNKVKSNISQKKLSKKLGIAQSTISNYMNLLNLPAGLYKEKFLKYEPELYWKIVEAYKQKQEKENG